MTGKGWRAAGGVLPGDRVTAGEGACALEVAFTGVGQLEERVAFREVWGGV